MNPPGHNLSRRADGGTGTILRVFRTSILAVLASLLLFLPRFPALELDFTYASAPVDNPLKGLVPYAGMANTFPHSMEFQYLPLSDLMPDENRFHWDPIDRLLDDGAGRHCQTIFRIWIDYPGKKSGLPAWLQDSGVQLRPLPVPEGGYKELADYEHPRLREALRTFIAALGARYDRDPRVACITARLLGWWGEWHTWPASGMMASQTVQAEILDAYASAFHETPILLRYPRPENAPLPFGYHDDSFAWSTLANGNSHHFLSLLNKAGPEAQMRWRTHPIGGEVRPEIWPTLWNENGQPKEYQDFATCVRETHASWLMDSSIKRALTPEQRQRALAAARLLGYEFQVTQAELTPAGADWSLAITVNNTGVAPFYRDWPVELGILSLSGRTLSIRSTDWTLRGLNPGDPPRRWQTSVPASDVGPLASSVAIRIPNPMPGGRSVRFANTAQLGEGDTWLPVGAFPR